MKTRAFKNKTRVHWLHCTLTCTVVMASGLLLWLRYSIGPSYPCSSRLADKGRARDFTVSDFRSEACISFPCLNLQMLKYWICVKVIITQLLKNKSGINTKNDLWYLPTVVFAFAFVQLIVVDAPIFADANVLRVSYPFWKYW